jgi:hypothetical protein
MAGELEIVPPRHRADLPCHGELLLSLSVRADALLTTI